MDRSKGPSRARAQPWKTAKLEAWEEAGVAGKIYGKPLGEFVYAKSGHKFKVKVFALYVKKVADRWPERKSANGSGSVTARPNGGSNTPICES